MRPGLVVAVLVLAVLAGAGLGFGARQVAGAPRWAVTPTGSAQSTAGGTGQVSSPGSARPSAGPATAPTNLLLQPAELAAVGLPSFTGSPGSGEPPFTVNPCFPASMTSVSGAAPTAYVTLTRDKVTLNEQVVVTASSAEAQRIGTEYYNWHTNCSAPTAKEFTPGSAEMITVDGGSCTVVTLYTANSGDPDPVAFSFVVRIRNIVAVVWLAGPGLAGTSTDRVAAAIAKRLG